MSTYKQRMKSVADLILYTHQSIVDKDQDSIKKSVELMFPFLLSVKNSSYTVTLADVRSNMHVIGKIDESEVMLSEMQEIKDKKMSTNYNIKIKLTTDDLKNSQILSSCSYLCF